MISSSICINPYEEGNPLVPVEESTVIVSSLKVMESFNVTLSIISVNESTFTYSSIF
jgi:hypothetical protein